MNLLHSAVTTRKKFRYSWMMGIFIVGLLFIFLEVFLRQFHFSFEPETEFAYPRPEDFAHLRYDPNVFWTLDPDQPEVNSWGFPGDEIITPKPAEVYRILFLGDSIMQAGYPILVEQCLRETGFANAEAITLAVNGYSSFQGRFLAKKYGSLLEPDLVVVQFGWNDHWLAFGKPDSEKVLLPPKATKPLWLKALESIRVYQGLRWIGSWITGQDVNRVTGELRVSPEEYRENLLGIRKLFKTNHIPVLIVTTPSGLEVLGVPAHLITRGFTSDGESAIRLHAQYNHLVREVAKNGLLLDLEKHYAEKSKKDLASLFQEDNVHPSKAGTQEIAGQVCAFIQTLINDK